MEMTAFVTMVTILTAALFTARAIGVLLPKIRLFFLILLFCTTAFAQKNVAVLEIERHPDIVNEISRAEANEITDVIRSEAVNILPRSRYNVMTTESIMAMGGAVLEECAGETCIMTIGRAIDAEYVVRGTIRKFQTMFTLNVSMFETEFGNLVATATPIRSTNLIEVLDKSAIVSADMYRRFMSSGTQATVSPPTPTPSPVATPTPPPVAPPPPPTYTLTIRNNPAAGGSIQVDPRQPRYNAGTKVTMTAAPTVGFRFMGWTSDDSKTVISTNPTLQGTMNKNMTFTANFEPITYKLTVNAKPANGGTVRMSPNQPNYNHGTRVTMTASPAAGYRFTGWTDASGARIGDHHTLERSINRNTELTANFELVTYRLTVNARPSAGGDVSIDPKQPDYRAGSKVTVAAVTNEGYQFTGWTGTLFSVKDSMTITMDRDLSLTANYRVVRTAAEKRKIALQISGSALAIGGFVGGVIVNGMVESEYEKYNKALNTRDMREAKKNAENHASTRDLLYILGAVGLSGFAITLFF